MQRHSLFVGTEMNVTSRIPLSGNGSSRDDLAHNEEKGDMAIEAIKALLQDPAVAYLLKVLEALPAEDRQLVLAAANTLKAAREPRGH